MDIFNMFDNLINQSAQQYVGPNKQTYNRWKYCVALTKLGWEAYDFEAIPSETEDEVIIKWRKEGKEEIHLKLGFTDQRLWIKYMQHQKEKQDEKNTKNK